MFKYKGDLIVSNSKTVKPGLHLQVAACADREFFFPGGEAPTVILVCRGF